MPNTKKILIQYKPSEIDVILQQGNKNRQISSQPAEDEITLQEAKQKLYELVVRMQKKYRSIPISVTIQLTSKKGNDKKWKKFINEVFATTGASIGLSKK